MREGEELRKVFFLVLDKNSKREFTISMLSVETKDSYDATRILDPDFIPFLINPLKSECCLIGILNRDFLFAFNIVPGGTTRSMHEQMIRDTLKRDHPLSTRLFFATKEGWLLSLTDDYTVVVNGEEFGVNP